MSTHIGIGFSQNIDSAKAAEQAALQAKTKLMTNAAHLVIVLTTTHYNPARLLPIIRQIFDTAKIIGTSTAGIILPERIETRGIAVLSIYSDELKMGIGFIDPGAGDNIYQKGMALAQQSLNDFSQQGRQAFFCFVNEQLKSDAQFLKGLQDVLGNIFPILGAGNSSASRETFHLFQDNVLKNSAVGLILGGHISVGVGNRHGFRPLGKPRIINECDGNIIRQIDGKKAASLYEEYFKERIINPRLIQNDRSIFYPLGIFIDGGNEYLLRTAIDILDDGSIVCQGDIPHGAQVHIMIGNKDSCKHAALEAAYETQKNLLGRQPKLILIIEDIARSKLLGRMAFQEIESIKKVFAREATQTPLIGFYASGEICPLQSAERFKKPQYQNGSIVILAIG